MTLKILSDATTPFGRKVTVAAMEKGIPFTEEFVSLADPDPLTPFNPLQQIPTLVTPEGGSVYDSTVILLYLDTLHGDAPLVPSERSTTILTSIALADGLMEAVLFHLLESRRPTECQDESVLARFRTRVERCICAADERLTDLGSGEVLGDTIAFACALQYVDSRFSTEWRARYANLSAWVDDFGSRRSMIATVPTRTSPV